MKRLPWRDLRFRWLVGFLAFCFLLPSHLLAQDDDDDDPPGRRNPLRIISVTGEPPFFRDTTTIRTEAEVDARWGLLIDPEDLDEEGDEERPAFILVGTYEFRDQGGTVVDRRETRREIGPFARPEDRDDDEGPVVIPLADSLVWDGLGSDGRPVAEGAITVEVVLLLFREVDRGNGNGPPDRPRRGRDRDEDEDDGGPGLQLLARSEAARTTVVVDVTPPSVTNPRPEDGSFTNDATPAFSADLFDASGIDEANSLFLIGGVLQPGGVFTQTSFTFRPTDPFPDDSYTWTLIVLDVAGNRTEVSSSFTVDTVSPTVASIEPEDGAVGVPETTAITLSFSESIDPATVTSSTFIVSTPEGPVPGTIAVTSPTAVFTSSAPLPSLTIVTVRATSGITDRAGNPLAPELTTSFVTRPSPPTGVTAEAGDQAVLVGWDANPEAGVTLYGVYRATTSGGPYAQVGQTSSLEFLDTGLSNGVTYFYVVTALGPFGGESAPSAEVSATPLALEDPPPPTIVRPSEGLKTNDFDLLVAGATIPGGRIEVEASGVVVAETTASPSGSYSVETSPLADGPYAIRARVSDAPDNWSDFAGPVNVIIDTTPPGQVTGLRLLPRYGEIELRWDANQEPDVIGYFIERSVDGGETFERINELLVAVTRYLDDNLDPSTEYGYRVLAVDDTTIER